MNKTVVLLLVLVFVVSVSAQNEDDNKTPETVITAFKTAHPDAHDISWDKEGMNYEAEYRENGNDCSVIIDQNGNILETETEIDISELPSGVIKYISDNYAGYTLSDASKIVDVKGNVKYEAEIKNGKTSKDVMFDQNGSPLKHEKEDMEDETEDEDQD
jgi:hypothetical protein